MGKFLGTLLFSSIQLLIFYSVTTAIFNVDWGENKWQIISLGFSYALAVSGLSMLLSAYLRDERTADSISGVWIQILAIMGGSMLPIYVFPDVIQNIANIAPNKWALTGFLKIMQGTDWQQLASSITVLAAIGISGLLLGMWRMNTKREAIR
jgi:ABC-2 type transport system permease protein